MSKEEKRDTLERDRVCQKKKREIEIETQRTENETKRRKLNNLMENTWIIFFLLWSLFSSPQITQLQEMSKTVTL